MDYKEKRKQMILALKKIVVPEIKKIGFSGAYPHFRQKENDLLRFVSFQFGQGYSSKVGSFVVEFRKGNHSELPQWSRELPFEKLSYGHVFQGHRLKVVSGMTDPREHAWFNYSDFTKVEEFENLAALVKEQLPQGVSFVSS